MIRLNGQRMAKDFPAPLNFLLPGSAKPGVKAAHHLDQNQTRISPLGKNPVKGSEEQEAIRRQVKIGFHDLPNFPEVVLTNETTTKNRHSENRTQGLTGITKPPDLLPAKEMTIKINLPTIEGSQKERMESFPPPALTDLILRMEIRNFQNHPFEARKVVIVFRNSKKMKNLFGQGLIVTPTQSDPPPGADELKERVILRSLMNPGRKSLFQNRQWINHLSPLTLIRLRPKAMG